MGQELFIPQGFGALDPRFANVPVDNELGEGIMGGYAVLTYPGKVWHVKHKGTDTKLLVNPDDPTSDVVQSIEVVILKSSRITKLYYINGWEEGSTARPDCYSSNGIVPDSDVITPQAHTCALCPHDAFGSSPTGKGKACSDGKRLAIVPLEDLENEFHGGPMLLRIPPDSLVPLQEYGDKLKKAGAPFYAVGTRIRFDPDKKHQRLLMNPIRALTREEVDIIMAHREDPRTARIINAVTESVTSEGNSPEQPFYEQADAQAPAPQQPPRRPAAPVQPAPGATPPPQKPAAQAPRPPGATTPPPAQPRPAQQAPKPVQAPPTHPAPIPASAQAPKPTGGFVARAPGTATQPSPVPQQRAAGGFARPTNPPAPQAPRPAPTTIAAAMAQPAPRPPTQRVVQQAPVIIEQPAAPVEQPVDDLDEYGNPVGTVYAEEGQQPEGEYVEEAPLPDGLDEKLNALLGV